MVKGFENPFLMVFQKGIWTRRGAGFGRSVFYFKGKRNVLQRNEFALECQDKLHNFPKHVWEQHWGESPLVIIGFQL